MDGAKSEAMRWKEQNLFGVMLNGPTFCAGGEKEVEVSHISNENCLLLSKLRTGERGSSKGVGWL